MAPPAAPAAPANPVDPLAGQLSTAPMGTQTLTDALAQGSANLIGSATAVQPMLSSAQSILTNLKSVSPGFNGGAATPDLMKLASGASSLGININPTGLADYQVFGKLAAQLANSAATGGAVDPGSDQRLQAIENANPNVYMSSQARSEAIATVQGALAAKSAYYQGALNAVASQPNIPPAQFSVSYARQWEKSFPNTTAFQFPYMTRQQQQKIYTSMSRADQQNLTTTANNAIQAGFMTKDAFINGGQ
jgi:hypothetical protein